MRRIQSACAVCSIAAILARVQPTTPEQPTESSLPAGFAARRPTAADTDALLDLVAATDRAVLGTSDATRAAVEAELNAPGYDATHAGWLVEASGHAAAGWLWTDDDQDANEIFVDAYALDDAVRSWLLDRALDIVAAAAGARPGLRATAGSYEHDRPYSGQLSARHFEVVRRFWHMTIDLTAERNRDRIAGASTPSARARGSAVIRLAEQTDDALRLVQRLQDESFADHWNHTARPFDEWLRRQELQPGYDPMQHWLAEIDGEPVGILLADDRGADVGEGWVRTLGVIPHARGRGVARALLMVAFEDAARRRRRRVRLGVDSANPTGATALYESVGMTVDRVLLAWARSAVM